MPRIGQLRHRAVLKTRTDAANAGTGGLTETYTTVATVWAGIENIAPTDQMAARQIVEGTTHQMTARWRSDADDITHVDRGTDRFKVLGFRDLDDRRRFQLWDLVMERSDV